MTLKAELLNSNTNIPQCLFANGALYVTSLASLIRAILQFGTDRPASVFASVSSAILSRFRPRFALLDFLAVL
jgi:hypothetical protein